MFTHLMNYPREKTVFQFILNGIEQPTLVAVNVIDEDEVVFIYEKENGENGFLLKRNWKKVIEPLEH